MKKTVKLLCAVFLAFAALLLFTSPASGLVEFYFAGTIYSGVLLIGAFFLESRMKGRKGSGYIPPPGPS